MNQRICIIIILLSTFKIVNAQISERVITAKEEKINTLYSSEFNFIHHDNLAEYKKYIGQEFYILPSNFGSYVTPSDKEMFDEMYYKTPREIEFEVQKGKKKVLQKKIIKHYLGDENDDFKYDNVGGKTFKVIDFDANQSKTITKGYNQLYFTLVEKSKNDTIIWTPKIYYFSYPYNVMIVSHLNFLKEKYKNKSYYARKNMANEESSPFNRRIINLLDGEKTTVEEKSLWNVVDISLVNVYTSSFKTPMVILTNNSKTVELPIYFLIEGSLNTTTRPSIYKDFMNSDEYENLEKKYTKINADAILTNKVKIGMTDEMCKLSWGEPDKINKSISQSDYTEQWVFGNSYLYFSKGILKNIQN